MAAAALMAVLAHSWARLRVWLGRDNGFLSTFVAFSITAWFAVYAVMAASAMTTGGISGNERLAFGAVVGAHYLLSWFDRGMRQLDPVAQAAPLCAAFATGGFVVAPGNFAAAAVAALAILLYQYGYRTNDTWGRHAFGIPMTVIGLTGVATTIAGYTSLGEGLLVAAGLVAGVRSVVAIFLKREERVWRGPS